MRSVPCIPQSTSASPRDRWFQKRQQELQTDQHSGECCCALILPDKRVKGPTKRKKYIFLLDCYTCEAAALKTCKLLCFINENMVTKVKCWIKSSKGGSVLVQLRTNLDWDTDRRTTSQPGKWDRYPYSYDWKEGKKRSVKQLGISTFKGSCLQWQDFGNLFEFSMT